MTDDNGTIHSDGEDDASPEDAAWLRGMLTDLAEDPAAPPSTVSPLSVIAAARREQASVDSTSADAARPAASSSSGPIDLRSRRRRRTLTALVAAACLAA